MNGHRVKNSYGRKNIGKKENVQCETCREVKEGERYLNYNRYLNQYKIHAKFWVRQGIILNRDVC